ncbi:MAG: acyl-CoA dehydrogenase family protein [Methyloligella sp. ZOD6]
MNYAEPTEQSRCTALLHWIREYGARRVNSLLIDTRRSIPPHIVLDFGNAGLLGLQAPRAAGGLGLSHKATTAILQQLAALDVNLAAFVVVHNFLGIRPIMLSASEPLRKDLLPQLASGRIIGGFALTEPGAGSNPNGIEARATRGADGRTRLSGTKMWIGNAGWAGVINVFARYTDERGKPCGSCAAAIPADAPGLIMGPELLTMGMRGMVQNMVRFDDVELPDSHRLGKLGEGMAVAHATMMTTRLALGAIFVGAMKRCLQLMTRYARRREGICSGRLIDNPISRQRISQTVARTAALEALIDHICDLLDRDEMPPEELLVVAKASGSEFLWQTADWAIQMLGGRGYIETNIVTQIMRDARVGRIFEGPTETLMHHLGSRLMLDDPGLRAHLSQTLKAGDIAERLTELRDALKGFGPALAGTYPGRQARDLCNSKLGEAVAAGVLYACARIARNARASWCPGWAEAAFEETLQDALSIGRDERQVLGGEDACNLIEEFESDIGNIEQTQPAEEWRLDPYLRKKMLKETALAW